MKIAKTLAVAGLLTVGSTAADASTFGWGSWSWSSKSSYSVSYSSSSWKSFGSRFNSNRYTPEPRGNAYGLLKKIRDRYTVEKPKDTPPPSSEVPLPASGLLLVGALGALALRRRNKT